MNQKTRHSSGNTQNAQTFVNNTCDNSGARAIKLHRSDAILTRTKPGVFDEILPRRAKYATKARAHITNKKRFVSDMCAV